MRIFGRPVKIDMGQFFSTISYQVTVLVNKFCPASAGIVLADRRKPDRTRLFYFLLENYQE